MEGEGLKGDEAREKEVILFILSFFLSPQFLFPVFLSCPRNLSYLVSFLAFVFYLFFLSFFLPFPFQDSVHFLSQHFCLAFLPPPFHSHTPSIFSVILKVFFLPVLLFLHCLAIFRSLPPPFLPFSSLSLFAFFHRLSIPVLPPVFPPLSFL